MSFEAPEDFSTASRQITEQNRMKPTKEVE
jgi:hypothetical protein